MKSESNEKELFCLTAPIIIKIIGIGFILLCLYMFAFKGVNLLSVYTCLIPFTIMLCLFAFNEKVIVSDEKITRRSWVRRSTEIRFDDVVQVEFVKLGYILLFSDREGNKLSVPTNLHNANRLIQLVKIWSEYGRGDRN